MNVIRLTYDSANYYLIQSSAGWIMVDTGWAGTFPELLNLLKRRGISAGEIRCLVITHFHPDHAGLVEEIRECGAQLLLHPCQVPFAGAMKRYFKPHQRFREIQVQNATVLSSAQSREFLRKIGVAGEIIATPGHSDDSISLIIDDDCAFTGDLPPPELAEPGSTVQQSWERILSYRVRQICPGHGDPSPL